MVSVDEYDVNSLSSNEEIAGNGQKKDHHKNFQNEKQNEQRKAHIPYTNSITDNEVLFKLLKDGSKKLDLRGKQILDRFAQWCVQHPQLAICLLAAVLVTSLPVVMFMAFALFTFVMTITGFLVLEGTLLTVITMIMFGILGAIGIALLFCTLVGFATYCGVSKVYDMYDSTTSQRTNLRDFMQNYNQNYISGSFPNKPATDNSSKGNVSNTPLN